MLARGRAAAKAPRGEGGRSWVRSTRQGRAHCTTATGAREGADCIFGIQESTLQHPFVPRFPPPGPILASPAHPSAGRVGLCGSEALLSASSAGRACACGC